MSNFLQNLAAAAQKKAVQVYHTAVNDVSHTVAPAATHIAGQAAYDATHNPVTNVIGHNVVQPAVHFMENGGLIGMQHPGYQQFSRGVSHGLERSAIGTGQAISGLYDLAGGQHGTNRVDKFLDHQAKGIDNIAHQQHVNPLLYKGSQAAGDALQMALGGGEVKLAGRALTELPKAGGAFKAAGKGLALTEKPAQAIARATKDGNFIQRVGGRTAANVLSPKYQAANAVFTAGQEGKNASHGLPVTARSAATDLAMGGLAFPATGAVGSEVIPGIRTATAALAHEPAAARLRMTAVDASNAEKRNIQQQLKGVNRQIAQQPLGTEGARGTNVLMGKQDTLQSRLTQNRLEHGQIQNPVQKVTDRLLTAPPLPSAKPSRGSDIRYQLTDAPKPVDGHGISDKELQDIVATHRNRFGDTKVQVGDTRANVRGSYGYEQDLITLAKGDKNLPATHNHESIHKAIGQFLSDSEIKQLYRDIASVRGGKRSLQQQYRGIGYKGIGWQGAAEEEIANHFNDFMADGRVTIMNSKNKAYAIAKWAAYKGLPQSVVRTFLKLAQHIDTFTQKGATQTAAAKRLESFYRKVDSGGFNGAARRTSKFDNRSLPEKVRHLAQDTAINAHYHTEMAKINLGIGMKSGDKLMIDKRAYADDLSPEQNKAIADYAEFLKQVGQGNGVDITADGRRVSNNFRTAENKGKAMTNTHWFDQARSDLESGKADSYAVEDYKQQPGLKQPTVAPKATPAAVSPQPAAKPQLPASRGTGGVSLPNNTPNVAESRFPLRMMEDPRTDPIREDLNQLAYHDVKHNAPVLASTAKNITQNEDAALSLAKRGSSTEANATAMQLINKYLSEGNYEKARDLTQTVAPRFTRQGQETQILAAYSKLTPSGALRYANAELAHAVKDTPKGRALEDATVTAHQGLQEHAKQVADQLSQEVATGKVGSVTIPKAAKDAKAPKTPEQMLADRIKATTDATKKQAPDPIKDMVNTLHSVAKEVLPAKGKAIPRDPMELIGQAIKDKQGYGNVYDKAKALVLDKYKDNPAALEELDKYFTSGIERTYSKSQLNKGVQNGLQGTDLGKIVKQHFTKVDETGQALQDKLVQQAGLSKPEAAQLSGDIQKRYDQLVAQRKDSIIKQMFGDKPKPEQVTAADRILTMHNLGALSRDELRPLVAKKLGVPSLSETATKNISDMANKIQTLKDGSPERARATVEMMRYIAEQVPQSRTSKAISVWKAGLLSGVKTQQGNAISNATFAGLKKVSDVPAAAVDKGISMFTGKRTIGMTSKGGISGGKQGIGTGIDTMKTGIDMRQPLSDGKYEQHAELSFNNRTANKLVAKPVNTIFRGMSAADQPFYYGAKQNSLYDQAKAAGLTQGLHGRELNRFVTDTVKNPTEAMVSRANQEADKAVLGNDTVASRAITAVKRSIDSSDMSPAGKAAAHTTIDVLAPFTKVPSAFIGRTVDFTPLGIPKTVISQISHRQFDQRALSQAIGEGVTGSGVIALGVALSQKSLISGDFPKNDQKEQERWKVEGIQPNSVKIYRGKDSNGKPKYSWISMNYIGPAGLLFNAGKQIADASSKGEGAMTKAFSAVGGLGQGLLGQSFLQGFSGFTNAVTDPQRSLSTYVKSQGSSVVPSFLNDIANVTDPMQRQANNLGQAIEGRIPGLRNKALQPKQDVYGNPLKQAGGQLNTLSGLKPSSSLTDKNPVVAEVNRLHTADPNNKDLQVTPTPIGKSITVDKQNVKLNDKQAYDLQKQVGQATQDAWGKLIKTPQYQQANDTEKARQLNNIKSYAAEDTQRQYVVNNNLGSYSKPETARAIGIHNGQDIAQLAASGGNAVSVSNKIDPHSQKVLNEYNTLDAATKKSKAYNEPSYDYKVAQAKYDNAVANGTLSKAQAISQKQAVTKAKVGSSFSKDTRDLYGLSKQEVYDLITTDPNGKKYAADLLAYGDALKSAGIEKNKFRTSKGVESFGDGTNSATKAAKAPAFKAYKSNLGATIKAAKGNGINPAKYKVAKISLSGKIKGTAMQKYKQPNLRKKFA